MKKRRHDKDTNVGDLCAKECNAVFKNNKWFRGVFASDELLGLEHLPPYGIIVNTDPKSKPGSHWIAIFAESSHHAEYFDSFGRPPFVSSIVEHLNSSADCFCYNTQCIQHPLSVACGHFAIGFLKARFNSISFASFLSRFNVDKLEENDQIVSEWNSNCQAYKQMTSQRSSIAKDSRMGMMTVSHATCL